MEGVDVLQSVYFYQMTMSYGRGRWFAKCIFLSNDSVVTRLQERGVGEGGGGRGGEEGGDETQTGFILLLLLRDRAMF